MEFSYEEYGCDCRFSRFQVQRESLKTLKIQENGAIGMENAEQNRITEIISELSSCREDERSAYNQILQVITVVGTILGILYGASFCRKIRGC